MFRKIMSVLTTWKNNPQHMPLLFRGARQVGKTHVIRELGKQFENFVEINFEQRPDVAKYFSEETQLIPQKIIDRLEIILDVPIVPRKTLLFLDEIQECPQAILALRYFKEQMPDLHVIGAGSLLEFVLNDAHFSFPVGRIQFVYVKPLSFEEFLEAIAPKLRGYLNTVELSKPHDDVIHQQLLAFMRTYLMVGGMPAVISAYLQTKRMKTAQETQEVLISTFRQDFGKYASKSEYKYLQTIFDKIPGLLAQTLKYTTIEADAPSRNIKHGVEQLCDAGLVQKVFCTHASGLPLMAGVNDKKFKPLFLDFIFFFWKTLLSWKFRKQQETKPIF